MIKPGEFYVGDRYYGRDSQVLNRLSEAVCSYLIRLREDSVMEVVEELPLVPADVKAGVGIQLYSAMIAALLLSRRLGKLPGKRLYEALQFHQAGWISEAELAAILPRNALKKTQ